MMNVYSLPKETKQGLQGMASFRKYILTELIRVPYTNTKLFIFIPRLKGLDFHWVLYTEVII